MNHEEEYIEIDLKAVLFSVLYQWKRLLAVAVTLALLLGGLQGIRTALPEKEEDEEQTALWSEIELYEYSLHAHEDKVISLQEKMLSLEGRMASLENKKVTFEEQMVAIQEKIDILQDDMDHSVLMKADYRNVYVARSTYHIDAGWQILPGNSYQDPDKTGTLNYYYRSLLTEYSVYEAISEKVGIEPKYLTELISIGCPTNNTIQLTVYHPYERSAIQIMEQLQTTLLQLHDQLIRDVEAHTLTPMLDSCGVYVEEWIRDMQQANKDELLEYQLDMDEAQNVLLETQNDLVKAQDELIKAQENLILAQEDLETFLEEEEIPEEPNPVKSFIKWGILGGVAGGALMVLWYAALAIFTKRCHNDASIAKNRQLVQLGTISRDQKTDKLTTWLRKREGRMVENTTANDYLLAENLKLHCDQDRVLLFSDSGIEMSTLAANRLQSLLPEKKLIPMGSLSVDAEALKAVKEDGSAVIVLTAGQSVKADVEKAVQLLRSQGKPVAGILLVD